MPAIETISTAAEVVIAAGLVLTLLQVRADHERSRREKAITLLFDWARSTEVKAEAARRLGDVLDFEQAKAVNLQQSFELDGRHKQLLCDVIDDMKAEDNGKIWVTKKQSTQIRFYMVKYLNSLETVLSAWRHHVADRKIIEEQFAGFVSHENREFLLENYRQAAGGKHTYPALAHFVSYVRREEERADRSSRKKIFA